MRKPMLLMLATSLFLTGPLLAQTQDNRVRLVQVLSGGPAAATWYKQRLLYAQSRLHQLMIWDSSQSNLFWSQEECQPVALTPTQDQHFLIACQSPAYLQLINAMGQDIARISQDAEGRTLSGIQALVQDSRGGIYLAVTGVEERGAAAAKKGKIYYLSPSRAQLTAVASQLDYPEALALSPNGQTLYVAEGLSRQIRHFDVQQTQLLNGRVFKKIQEIYTPSNTAVEEPSPAALAINRQGQLFIALRGEGRILVTSTGGKLLNTIQFPEAYLTSLSFGANERILYATAVSSPEPGAPGSLYEVRL